MQAAVSVISAFKSTLRKEPIEDHIEWTYSMNLNEALAIALVGTFIIMLFNDRYY
jgi:hypothetical protein